MLILTLDNAANVVIKLRQVLPFPLLQRLGLVLYYCGPTVHPRHLRTVLEAAGFTMGNPTAILHCPRVVAIPLAAFLERHAPPAVGAAFLRVLSACEKLGALPSRFLTGYFVAARCVRMF